MKYQFTAEFYQDKFCEKPIYKTLLWGVEDAEAFIQNQGFTKAPDFNPEYPVYTKEMRDIEVANLFPFDKNFELEEIIVAGKPCKKAIVYATGIDQDSEITLAFGVEQAYLARFSGNGSDSRVMISDMYSNLVVDLPLRCFKDKMGVLTLFEVMEKLDNDYHHASLDEIQKEFESGIERAIEIVSKEFDGDLDLDGNPQLLHMTAVSEAGKNPDERLVGMLHDLVEDKDWTFEDLLQDGFPRHIVDTLRLLTHSKETPYMDYVKNICESGNQVALAVKMNDLNHNLKRGRAGGHWQHVGKHEKALAYIQEFIEKQNGDE